MLSTISLQTQKKRDMFFSRIKSRDLYISITFVWVGGINPKQQLIRSSGVVALLILIFLAIIVWTLDLGTVDKFPAEIV